MKDVPVLVYFQGKGRAELSRLIFTCGEVPFDDQRLSFEEYGQMRSSGELPFGQLPILKLGDTVISQSCAIARYAAKQAGLYPIDHLQAALSDMIVDAWRDLQDLLYGCYVDRVVEQGQFIMKMRDASVKVKRLNEYFATSVPMHLEKLEQIITQNQASSFLVGSSLTWADIAVFDILCIYDHTGKLWNDPTAFAYIPEPDGPYQPPKDLLQPYPNLETLKNTVSQIPQITTWLQAHPY
ncbi:glutathione S-transferase family protein [Coleofasciculus chthonoplastes]|uniref:glutathione S-transferase family protein n=1 Tax=Coleofasciculus chthonoplastes TaxID=64178 RepID=UPI0032FB9A45